MARFLQSQVGGMMKEGTNINNAPILKNIEACKGLSAKTRSSLGPDGLNKMVINHLGKLFVTHDAATIMRELEVEHPAAKLLVMAAKSMEEEIGDATNAVVILAGELLNLAEQLVHMGIHPSHIITGYEKACESALRILPELVCSKVEDLRDPEQVAKALKTVIEAKQPGFADHLSKLLAEACCNVCPKNPKNFNVDNVRVAKLDGCSVGDSQLVHGFVMPRDTEGLIKEATDVKVAVYNCAIDSASTDTKGKVDITTAEELLNFSKTEEDYMEKAIEGIAKTGVKLVVSSQSFSDMALHFLERHGIMAFKVMSKFELRRLCAAVNATQIVSLDPPTPEEVGRCNSVKVQELGGKKVTIFSQVTETSKVSTIIIRGPTHNIIDDVERALDDGVNAYKALTRDPSLVAGAGACEMELSRRLTMVADECADMHQYAMRKYAEAFQVIPSTLAEVSGHNAVNVITSLMADHQNGSQANGVAIDTGLTLDALQAGILDLYLSKFWTIKFATEAAVTVLRVDTIVMAKQAGGPKQNPNGPGEEDE
uniref:CCT-theta n=1 Tax=Eutreptiella gymnastica TaxID=73025 RepID=A0A7S1HUW8_9EUGL|mmetsp:Transcript_10769/g.19167  ORF Transcript_10769/g.19167 Transcript_10769/m.19167 type:complete len:540 (+) Transcript_10769:35-1654(+)